MRTARRRLHVLVVVELSMTLVCAVYALHCRLQLNTLLTRSILSTTTDDNAIGSTTIAGQQWSRGAGVDSVVTPAVDVQLPSDRYDHYSVRRLSRSTRHSKDAVAVDDEMKFLRQRRPGLVPDRQVNEIVGLLDTSGFMSASPVVDSQPLRTAAVTEAVESDVANSVTVSDAEQTVLRSDGDDTSRTDTGRGRHHNSTIPHVLHQTSDDVNVPTQVRSHTHTQVAIRLLTYPS